MNKIHRNYKITLSDFTVKLLPPITHFLIQKFSPYIVDNIIFGISIPDYPSRTVESNSRDYFGISVYFVYFIFI